MQDIEPYYGWRDLYTAETDKRSPFFGRQYSEFEYTNTVYNYYLHPQWDDFGSHTLFAKILYVDYGKRVAIIELIGEWNDAIENDIRIFRKEVVDPLLFEGIVKFILIAENVLNFHSSEADYYEDWFEEVVDEAGWILCLNMPEAAQYEFLQKKLQYYVELKTFPDWRVYRPDLLFKKIDEEISKRLP